MSFEWTTFALEVLNFLVLVWLLKRFLYQPVLRVIEQRRAESEKTGLEAAKLRDDALALRAAYEARLAAAAAAHDRAIGQLDDEIAAQRASRLTLLEAEMGAERERRLALEVRERAERDAARDRQAAMLAARFATRLMDRLASPQLEEALVELTVADLQAMAPEQRAALQGALAGADTTVQVVTAYALDAHKRAALGSALSTVAQRTLTPEFHEDPMLKAGVCVRAGAWMLMANLRDELEFFGSNIDHA